MKPPSALVLDAGPLIALLHANDPDHQVAVRGFSALAENNSRLIASAAIVLEVSKWLLFEAGRVQMRRALQQMREALVVLPVGLDEMDAAQTLLEKLPNWNGTLEDALVALTALQTRTPVWTLNYRDLNAFAALEFWNP